MTTMYYRSIYDELYDLRRYLDSLYQQMEGIQKTALLPSAGEHLKMLPSWRTDMKVSLTERDDEIIITTVIDEGIAKKEISLDLINPQLLEISGKRKEEKREEKTGYYSYQERFGSSVQVIQLPHPVTEEGSVAVFRNDVLEIHLKKERRRSGSKIVIE